jgi:hypothetical protein
VPPWDAPAPFFLWLRATETSDFGLVLRAPLCKENWHAAKLLFSAPGFRQGYDLAAFRMLKALLERGG